MQLLRLLIWVLLAGALYWAVRQLVGDKFEDHAHGRGGSERMVRDPRCGVYLPESEAVKRRIGGETVFFCSRKCEKEYRKEKS